MDHSNHDHDHHMDSQSNPLTHSMHPTSVGMDSNTSMEHHGHMSMAMYFHFGMNDFVLFEFWKVSSVGTLVFSMILIFIAAMLYEAIKYFREYLFWKHYSMLQYQNVSNTPMNSENSAANNLVNEVIHKQPPTMLSVHHAVQTLLHIVQMLVSYLLMLIFMTYNVWLCIPVVLGAGTGYFLFGWKKALFVDVTDHCH